jgi:GT2 family glycosyltransferase
MISLILLHHNKAEYSRACLHSLLRSVARPLEIINVDNGSRDETPRVLDAWENAARDAGIATRRLNFDENIGAVRGRNEALQIAGGDYLVFLDNDTLIAQADWLENLQAFLEADAKRGIVAPKLVFPWEPFHIEACGAGISRRGRVQYIGRGEPRDAISEPRLVQCAISAAWMMPRRLYETIGPLDEEYSPVQYEDLDYCYHARAAGFEVWTLPAVEVYHFEHTTTAGSGDINFAYVTTKNGLTFKKRWQTTYTAEDGPDEAATAWKSLPKRDIGDVDWEGLLAKGDGNK